MELTLINPADLYRARVEQLEREYLGHQLLQEEIKQNPDVTGEDEQKALAESQENVAKIEVAHSAACDLLKTAEANETPKGNTE